MTVKDLRELLNDAPDEMQVLIPVNPVFDGMFISPCIEESGVSDLGLYEDENDEKQAELLNKPVTEKSFVLVGCGFFEEHQGPPVELN